MTTFRTSISEDLPFLREMLYLAIHVDPDEPPPPPEIIASPVLSQYIEGFGEQRGDIGIVALDDGQRVGAAWVRLIKGYGFVGDNIPELSIAILPDSGRGSASDRNCWRNYFLWSNRILSKSA